MFQVTDMHNNTEGYGGEQVSLAIQSRVSDRFRKAGYAKIQTNASYVGGYVRQYGNLSFSRVFDAGHEGEFPWPYTRFNAMELRTDGAAPSYQPETTYRIFNRVMFDRDVATGKISTAWPFSLIYATVGPDNVDNVANAVPVQHPAECYLWAIALTCTREQTEMLRSGTAILKDYIMIGYEKADGSIHYY
jgi:carboxypeptidase D